MPAHSKTKTPNVAIRERASWLINAGADDTIRGLSAMTGTPDDIAVLKLAIGEELAKPQLSQRSSRLKPMESKLRKFMGPTELGMTVAETVEVMPKKKHDPAWDNARLYYRAVRTTGRQFLVSQICLGWELATKKKELGFAGSGRRSESGHVSTLTQKTWEDYLHDEIDPDLNRRTADRLIGVFEGFREKAPKKLLAGFTSTNKRSLITTLSKPPGALTTKERETIELAICKCSDGETQRSLLEEFNLVKVHKALTGGDTSGSKKPKLSDAELMGQLAFKFFEPIAKDLQEFRTNGDRDAFLATLDLHSSDSGAITLTTLEADLEAALETVRSVKKAKLKTAKGTVIS